jgi:F0F1-type ATP synthase membrane subunit b/b'
MVSVKKPEKELHNKKEEALRDLSPEVRETVEKIMRKYQGEKLEDKLNDITGVRKTRKLWEKNN